MFVIAGIVLVGACIALVEGPYLVKKKMKKELYIFAGLLLVGEVLSIMLALRVPLPNPYDLITFIYRPISNYVFSILK